MKLNARKLGIGLVLLWVASLAACALPPEEGEGDRGITRQALEDLDERGTAQLWDWYLEQGWEPCDPPPDPWHPFIKYGYCSVDGEVEHEAIPNASYDE